MSKENKGIGFFERYLTIWVTLCIIAGIAIGQWIPAVPETLGKWEYANVSIPIAVLIWLMIYPMMLKVDFQSVRNVGKRPKGILITCVTNWLIKPFTMFGIAWFFFFVVFKTFIPISCWCCSSWCCSMHRDGVCMELSYKGRCGLYTCSGRGK